MTTSRCRNCQAAIEYVPYVRTATETVRREGFGDLKTWFHVDGGVQCPNVTPARLAEPVPRCPRCASANYRTVAEAWLNRTTCGDCGHVDIYMLGD